MSFSSLPLSSPCTPLAHTHTSSADCSPAASLRLSRMFSTPPTSTTPQIVSSVYSVNRSLLNRTDPQNSTNVLRNDAHPPVPASSCPLHPCRSCFYTQRLSDALPTFSCWSTPFRISGSSQQHIGTVCSATRPSLGQAAQRFELFLLAEVADAFDGEKARRTAGDRVAHAADAGEQRHALVGGRSGGSAGTAKRVQNPSFVRRISLS